MANKAKISRIFSGISGEYLVASELSRRGYIASVTLKNTKVVDILASSEDASHLVGIQVKTNQKPRKMWVLTPDSEKIAADHLFYVFVNLNTDTAEKPEFYVVPSKTVAAQIKRDYKAFIARGGKETTMRDFVLAGDTCRDNWEVLGL